MVNIDKLYQNYDVLAKAEDKSKVSVWYDFLFTDVLTVL